MTVETVSLAAGAVLSLLFSYVPGVSEWFGKQTPTIKRLIMAAALLVVSLAVFGAACANLQIPGSTIECSAQGAWLLVQTYLLALVANQAAYQITKPSKP